jgi:sugar lactone lactonase YvrE
MVIVGTTNDTAYKYTLSTAWDISTASYDSESYFVNKQTSGVAFGKDGTKMYVTDMDADSIWEYDT